LSFSPAVNSQEETERDKSLLFAFKGEKLLVNEVDDRYQVPLLKETNEITPGKGKKHYIGNLAEKPCFAVELDDGFRIKDKFHLVGLRELFGLLDDQSFRAALTGIQIVSWDRMHKFCGKCGAVTNYSQTDRAKVCNQCGSVYYPRISPAVIVAIRRGDKLLLLRNKQFKRDFYSVLAGFVEPGESLEECLVREVKEEAGIEVKNIQYFGSQPWPFPNSLMVGFTADYAGGDLQVDGVEISDAGWFTPENFPNLPGPISIARKLIDAFVEEQKVRK